MKTTAAAQICSSPPEAAHHSGMNTLLLVTYA